MMNFKMKNILYMIYYMGCAEDALVGKISQHDKKIERAKDQIDSCFPGVIRPSSMLCNISYTLK